MIDTPPTVMRMAALFIAAQKPHTYTTGHEWARDYHHYWERERGVVYCYAPQLRIFSGDKVQAVSHELAEHRLLYRVFVALADYQPVIYWDGEQWRKTQKLDFPVIASPVIDERYRWLIC